MSHDDLPSDYDTPAQESLEKWSIDRTKPKAAKEPDLLNELILRARDRADAEQEAQKLILRKQQLEDDIKRLAAERLAKASTSDAARDAFVVNFIMGVSSGNLGDNFIIVPCPAGSSYGSARLVYWTDTAPAYGYVLAIREGNLINPVFLLRTGMLSELPSKMTQELKHSLNKYMKAWTELPGELLPHQQDVALITRKKETKK